MTDDSDMPEGEARALLDRLGADRKKLEAKLDDVQKETHDAIVGILMARTLGPSEVARRVQYDRQHVARIAKKAGVPPLREATVVSRREVRNGARRPEPPPDRPPERRPAEPSPISRPSRPVVQSVGRGPVMSDARAVTLSALAHERADTQQRARLDQSAQSVSEAYRTFAVVAEAQAMGLITTAELHHVDDETDPAPARPAAEES